MRQVFVRLSALALACASGFGCASSARLVTVEPGGGVVAIPSNSNAWPSYNRKGAEELMRQQCPGGYVIDHEQEVVVGQVQQTNVNTDRKGDPLLAALHVAPVTENTQQTTSYTDKTEWRIWFHAVGAQPVAVPPKGPIVQTGTAPK